MLKTDDRLEYRQLLDEFLLGCKTEERIGMEYERIPVSLYGKNIVPYEGDFGMCELLREFAKADNWDYILDEDNIIGELYDSGNRAIPIRPKLTINPDKTTWYKKERHNVRAIKYIYYKMLY